MADDHVQDCVLASKTRRKTCNGNLYEVTNDIRRCCLLNSKQSLLICKFHQQQIRRSDLRRCSCPAPWTHSKKLSRRPIPSRLYPVFDEVGEEHSTYVPGTRWCNKCKLQCDDLFFPNKTSYEAPQSFRDRSPLQVKVGGNFLPRETEELGILFQDGDGNVLLSKNQWIDIQSRLQAPSFSSLVVMLQQAMSQQSTSEIFKDINKFKEFVLHKVPDLYTEMERAIIKPGMSSKRIELQEKRILAILNIIVYYRSQKLSSLQKNLGLLLNMQGISQETQDVCQVLGLSTHSRTINETKKHISRDHFKNVQQAMERKLRIKGKSFILAIVDDFHNIHGFRSMTSGYKDLKTSQAVHMATSLLDVLPISPLVVPPAGPDYFTH